MQDDVEGAAAVVVHELLDAGLALGPGDVFLDGDGATDGGDGGEVHADHQVVHGYALDHHLHPPSGGGAEVQHGAGRFQEAELGVELDQLP